MDILLLLVGLGLILGGANFLTDGSAAVAQRFRVPEFIIGLTIVAVGTSMPELVVSVLSAAAGNSDVAIGNVVGSNIFNVFVILGICALIRPLVLTKENIRRDIPFGMAASLVLLAVTSDRLVCAGATDRIGRPDGIVMLALYIGLMWYMIRTTKRQRGMPGAAGGTIIPASEAGAIVKNGVKQAEGTKKPMALWLAGVMIAGGLAGLIFGGEMFLKSATAIARTLGISESVIAITLVAGGTSLPELASSVVSLLKGKAEMALGNVIGSNIANILLILGISATIHPLTMGGITLTDILVVVLSSLLLFMAAFTFRSKKLDRWEGAIFLGDLHRLHLVFGQVTVDQPAAGHSRPARAVSTDGKAGMASHSMRWKTACKSWCESWCPGIVMLRRRCHLPLPSNSRNAAVAASSAKSAALSVSTSGNSYNPCQISPPPRRCSSVCPPQVTCR